MLTSGSVSHAQEGHAHHSTVVQFCCGTIFVLKVSTFISIIQDPFRMNEYLAGNIFLPDVNNERAVKNATYADNLASLERLVLYRFEKEYTVVPRGRCVI